MSADEGGVSRHDDGAVGLIVAILTPLVLLGLVALVINVGSLYVERSALQSAADAAALAAARQWATVEDPALAVVAAEDYVAKNKPARASVVTLVTFEDNGTVVRVKVTESGFEAPLARLFGGQATPVWASAAAVAREPGTAIAPEMALMLEQGANPPFSKWRWYDVLKNDGTPEGKWKDFSPKDFAPEEGDQLAPVASGKPQEAVAVPAEGSRDYYWKAGANGYAPDGNVPAIRCFEQALSPDLACNSPDNSLKPSTKNNIKFIEVAADEEFVTKNDVVDVRRTAFEDLAALIRAGLPADDPRRLFIMPVCEWPAWMQGWQAGQPITLSDFGTPDPGTYFWNAAKYPRRSTDETDTNFQINKALRTVVVVSFVWMRVDALLESPTKTTTDAGRAKGMRATYLRTVTPAEADEFVSWRIKRKRPKKHQPPGPPPPYTQIPYSDLPFSMVRLVP